MALQSAGFSSQWLNSGDWDPETKKARITFHDGHVQTTYLSADEWGHLTMASGSGTGGGPGSVWHDFMGRGIDKRGSAP
tara:strand:+ start:5498 stop:5734 length:237 start_codon:yes stop_codon:yes gene_type:complete